MAKKEKSDKAEEGREADIAESAEERVSVLSARVSELEAENNRLRVQLSTGGGLSEEEAAIVEQKMAAGLTREMAIEVMRSQQAHDKTKPHDKK